MIVIDRETKLEHYRTFADEMFLLCKAFKESGFTDDQAFELTSCYVRQSIYESMQRERKMRSRSDSLRREFKEDCRHD